MGSADSGAWSPQPPTYPGTLWVEEGLNDKWFQLRHPGVVWLVELPARENMAPEKALKSAACNYLNALKHLALPDHLTSSLGLATNQLQKESAPRAQGQFAWLPLRWGTQPGLPEDVNPLSSYLLPRGGADWHEATLVLLAARRFNDKALGDNVGVHVVARVRRKGASQPWELGFSSLSASLLDQAEGAVKSVWHDRLKDSKRSDTVRINLASALNLSHTSVQAIRSMSDKRLRLEGVGLRKRKALPGDRKGYKPRARVFGFVVDVDADFSVQHIINVVELSSSSGLSPQLFERDPASAGERATIMERAPGRADEAVDSVRELALSALWQNVDAKADFVIRLSDSATQTQRSASPIALGKRFSISHERRDGAGEASQPYDATHLGEDNTKTPREAALPAAEPVKTSDGTKAKQTPKRPLPLRSDDLAAAQAHLRVRELFDRLEAYGFNAGHYFRHARLPLELRARGRLGWEPEGLTLNAEVSLFYRGSVPKVDLLSPLGNSRFDTNQRPQLLVRLGSADSVNTRHGQALGLAADPRWVWHEFGHVLNFVGTGELEFAFAHSAGDALAAITADPDSGLAEDPKWGGYTFPWAFASRRHDHGANKGYCWCGERSRLRLLTRERGLHYRTQYFEEELLSSSLFRLYQCIGGATRQVGRRPTNETSLPTPLPEPSEPGDSKDLATRREASDYVVYLVVHAIALLGPNSVVPAKTADHFVTALIDADLATKQWAIKAPWPYRLQQQRAVSRRGGLLHKVIRWAFEQQGLYATEKAGEVAEGVGLAPPIDHYIADLRGSGLSDGQDALCDGGYWPVPLRWKEESQVAPAWHAHPDAIKRSGSPEGGWVVEVAYRERGSLKQEQWPKDTQPNVRVWVSPAASEGVLKWTLCAATSAGSGHQFSLPRITGQQAIWVLAVVDSQADPSLLPIGIEMPPTQAAELLAWVPNDNNAGLAYFSA
jgi:hypothetical protein